MPDTNQQRFEAACNRALFFLKLSIEQIRTFDPVHASILAAQYLRPLEHAFKEAIGRARAGHRGSLEPHDVQGLQGHCNRLFAEALARLPPSPPGLGDGVFPESEGRIFCEQQAPRPTQSPPFASPMQPAQKTDGSGLSSFGSCELRSVASTPRRGPYGTSFTTVETNSPFPEMRSGERPGSGSMLQALCDGSDPLSPSTTKPTPIGHGPKTQFPPRASSLGWNIGNSATIDYAHRRENRSDWGSRSASDSTIKPGSLTESVTTVYPSDKGITGRAVQDRPHGYYAQHPSSVTHKRLSSLVESFPQKPSDNSVTSSPSLITPKKVSHVARNSWAKVAAIPPGLATEPATAASGSQCFSGLWTSENTLSAEQTRLAAVNSSIVRTPEKPKTEDFRVVWLTGLPADYKLHDIGSRITEGAIMSILLEDNITRELPGHSACIIFQHAETAAQFLANNKPDATTERLRAASHASCVNCISAAVQAAAVPHPTKFTQHNIPSLPAVRPEPFNRTTAARISNPISAPGLLRPTRHLAPASMLITGTEFEVDESLASMGPPTFARRRLKWSRSRLFHNVPLPRFKADIYALVGPQNVELFHFYNPGECTVVFASVAVASFVLHRFLEWKVGMGIGLGREAEGVDLSKFIRSPRKPGRVESWKPQGLLGIRKEDLVARYEMVEVGFVHDFNEAPARLVTQYMPDGKVRKIAVGEGLERLYEGPDILLP